MKEINIVVLYMYARTRISHGYDEVGFSRNRLASLDAPEKYEIIVQKLPIRHALGKTLNLLVTNFQKF